MASADGREKTLAIVGRNGLIGQVGATSAASYPYTAVTTTAATLWVFTTEEFRDAIAASPTLSRQVIEFLNMKVHMLAIYSHLLAYGTPLQRIGCALVSLAMTYGQWSSNGSVRIAIPFTQQEMADLVGTSRVTVALGLGRLVKSGLISRNGRYYRIHDVPKLLCVMEEASGEST